MKREQIVELLNSNIKIQERYNPRRDTCDQWIEGIDKAADAILALPIDVPSETELEMQCQQELPIRIACWLQGARWAINEIIERNKI